MSTETCTESCVESCGGGGVEIQFHCPSGLPISTSGGTNSQFISEVASWLGGKERILKRMNSYVGIPATDLACYCYEIFVLKFVTDAVFRIQF